MRQLFILLSLLWTAGGFAQEIIQDSQVLIVESIDGSKTEYQLDSNPILSFSDTDLIISSDNCIVTFPVVELRGYEFADKTSGVLSTETENHRISFFNNTLYVYQPTKTIDVNLFSISGILITRLVCKQGKSISIDLSNYPKGVYVASAGSKTIKIILR